MGDNSACCYTYSNGYNKKGTKRAPFPPSLLSGEHKYRYIYALLEKIDFAVCSRPKVGWVGWEHEQGLCRFAKEWKHFRGMYGKVVWVLDLTNETETFAAECTDNAFFTKE